ncbi:MAG: amidase [Proteobacteria bacterium]|nr:amidase [Pseudomonadota bacterium]
MPYIMQDNNSRDERNMTELGQWRIRDLANAIRERKISAVEATRHYLDRIEKVNPNLNAVIHLEPDTALKHAERADLALKGGETPGRLFGIPMTIKDSLDTYDMVTTWGTSGRAAVRTGRDATCVGRLRNEGAILMGKTNTPEFTLDFRTTNDLFGRTSNPFDLTRTPGGSSGGAAAAIAAGATPFDVGTDTGGSIRLPSHFCGIAGLKPTTGRIPCTGNALPSTGLLAPLTQPGPMARCVDDLAYLLDIMHGPDNQDPHAVPATLRDYDLVDIAQLKIGYHSDNGISQPDECIRDAVDHAIDALQAKGIRTKETRPTGIEMAGFIYSRLFSADHGDLIETLLEDCRTTTPSPGVARLLTHRPPPLGAAEFAQTITLWHNYQASMLSYFDDFDVLISPVNAHPAITHEEPEDFAAYSYTTAYNLTGWPAVVIRAGTSPLGLPVGIQVIASPFREDLCLAVAAWLEAELGQFPGPDCE